MENPSTFLYLFHEYSLKKTIVPNVKFTQLIEDQKFTQKYTKFQQFPRICLSNSSTVNAVAGSLLRIDKLPSPFESFEED
jgi:hypothetical protein